MKFGDLAGIIINGMFKLHLQSKVIPHWDVWE